MPVIWMEKCRHNKKSVSSMSKRHCYKLSKTLMSPKLQLVDATVAHSELGIVLRFLYSTWLFHDFNAQKLLEAPGSMNCHILRGEHSSPATLQQIFQSIHPYKIPPDVAWTVSPIREACKVGPASRKISCLCTAKGVRPSSRRKDPL